MSSRKSKWEAMAPIEGLRLRARGIEDAATNKALGEYLHSANLRIVRLEATESLRLRMTRFPELTFARANLPRANIEWPRDELSHTRAAIVLCVSGQVKATPASAVLHRSPGLFLVPPGTETVSFETVSPLNEVLYISAPASLVDDLDVLPHGRDQRPEIPATTLAPLVAFALSLSSGSIGSPLVIGPLRSAATEVAHALARLIAEGDPSDLTLFSRTVRLIVDNHSDPRLSVPQLASMAGVSPRSLQAAFATEGTTVARELRATRLRSATELKRLDPGLPAKQIARAAGFGSVSTLYRAIEAEPEPCG